MERMGVHGNVGRDTRRLQFLVFHMPHAAIGEVGDIRHEGAERLAWHTEAETPFRSRFASALGPGVKSDEKRRSYERVAALVVHFLQGSAHDPFKGGFGLREDDLASLRLFWFH